MMDLLLSVFYLFIFPGFLFLLVMGLFCEWLDRKLYARMQNRVGPPVLQPVADLIKLLTKEDIIPKNADRVLFQYAPLIAFAAVMTPIMAIPIWGPTALYPLQGDLIITLYLLSIPTLALFVIGWSSASLYPLVGGFRAATMVFGYEDPAHPCLPFCRYHRRFMVRFRDHRVSDAPPLRHARAPPGVCDRAYRARGKTRTLTIRYPARRDRNCRRCPDGIFRQKTCRHAHDRRHRDGGWGLTHCRRLLGRIHIPRRECSPCRDGPHGAAQFCALPCKGARCCLPSRADQDHVRPAADRPDAGFFMEIPCHGRDPPALHRDLCMSRSFRGE